MGFKAITRNTPPEDAPHILSEDDAAIYRGILGQDGVLNIGSKLKSTVISNNKVRVGDGVINVDGHIGRNTYADYEDLTIENGSAGKKRHDLIVASFSTTGSGGLDTYILKVIKGAAGDTGVDPAVTKQDIYAGGKLREYPLYRVKLDGLSIVAVEQMFKVIPTVPELETKYNELNSTLFNKIFPIGSIYMSVSNTNPSEYFGGTWVQWGSGRVPVGVDPMQSEFNNVEKTGGTKTVDLSHSHTVNSHSHSSPSHSHSLTSGWAKIGRCANYPEGIAYKTGAGAGSTTYDRAQTNGGGIVGGSFAATDTTALGGSTSSISPGNTGSSSPGTSSGLSGSQSILQPYVTCYMWKRTA